MHIDDNFNYIIASYAACGGLLLVLTLKTTFSYLKQRKISRNSDILQ